MNINKSLSAIILLSSITIISCDEKELTPPVVNEEELITTLKLNFAADGDSTTFRFKDPDGDGGASGSTDTIRIQNGKTYVVTIELLNESVTPAKNLTEEIVEESTDHLFCFQVSGAGVVIARTDQDDNNREIGLSSAWQTTSAGTGSVTVTLKHQPGIKNGSCDPGETDIEVIFPVIVQ